MNCSTELSSESDAEDQRRDSESGQTDDGSSARRRALLVSSRAAASSVLAAYVNGGGAVNVGEEEQFDSETAAEVGDGVSGDVFEPDSVEAHQARAVDERHQLLFERNRLRHHKRQLEDLLDNSEDSNKQLTDRVKSLEVELTGLRRTNHQLKRRLEEETARADAMERRAAQAESTGTALRQEVGRLRDRNSRLREELRHSQGSIAEFLNDVAEKRACIKKLEADLASLRDGCNRLSAASLQEQQQQQQLKQTLKAAAQQVQPPEGQIELQKQGKSTEVEQSIRDEILSQVSQPALSSGPSPFCGKPISDSGDEKTDGGADAGESIDVSKLIVERDLYRQQLHEASERMRSTAGLIRHGLLEKFGALERQVRLERRENRRLTEQLRRCHDRQNSACSDSSCQVGEPFMRSEPQGRFDARFPRSVFLHQRRRLSTGLIGKRFRIGSELNQPKSDSSVDALDLAVKSATGPASTTASAQASSSESAASLQISHAMLSLHKRQQKPQLPQKQQNAPPESAVPKVDAESHHHSNLFPRRKRRVSFGSPLSQAPDQQERERYLQDLVCRPVQQEDASLTEEDRQRNSQLLRQAAEASSSSRQREDSTASSQDPSPRHNNRPSRTSSSFMSSMKQESDYSLWSRSETAGASLSVDDFSRSLSQAEEAATETVEPAPTSAQRRGHSPRLTGEASKSDAPFPSLPNSRLQSLSLLPASLTDLDARNASVSLIDPSRRFRLEDIADTELEDRVRALALSFSNDATTLVGRVKRLYMSRMNLEQNVAAELQALESDLAALNSGVQAPAPSSERLAVLKELLDKLNCAAEILGAVQQESRLNYAFHLMLKYMETLKEDKEKLTVELEQMRQAMDEGKFYLTDDDLMSKRSKSVIGAASQKENQRAKLPDLGRTVARTSSISSLRRRMSRDRKSTDEPDGDKDGKDSKKWKIEEEIYQSGFERGVRMSTSQQLSQLKTEQAAFSDQMEQLLDRQHLTEAEEADLERLSTDWLADKRLRLFLAPCTLLAAAALLIWAIAYPVARQLLTR